MKNVNLNDTPTTLHDAMKDGKLNSIEAKELRSAVLSDIGNAGNPQATAAAIDRLVDGRALWRAATCGRARAVVDSLPADMQMEVNCFKAARQLHYHGGMANVLANTVQDIVEWAAAQLGVEPASIRLATIHGDPNRYSLTLQSGGTTHVIDATRTSESSERPCFKYDCVIRSEG